MFENLGILIPLMGVAAVWGAMVWRTGRLESDLKVAQKNATGLSDRLVALETSRTDQGVRLGKVEDRIAKLEGFQTGYAAGRKATKQLQEG